jgi:drug/metabolite transporter (DMT)-like permease
MARPFLWWCCALWGVQQAAVKVAVAGGLGPLLQAGLRSAVAAALVLGWIAMRQGTQSVRACFRRDAATVPSVAIALMFAFEFLALYPGVRLTTASRAVLFLYTAPFFTAFGAHLFLPRERLRVTQTLGLLIAFAGVAAAFADGLAGGGGSVAGDVLCLAAGALWGATTVMIKASPALARTSSARILFVQLAGSAPILLAASWLAGENLWPHAPALAWASLFYQTVIVGFLSYLAWFALIQRYPAGKLAGFTFLAPVFGVAAAALLLGEHAGLPLLAGLASIAVGLRMVNRVG